MKNKLILLAIPLVVLAAVPSYLLMRSSARTAGAKGAVEVYFSTKDGCGPAVIDVFRQAASSIQVQAYSFTNPEIAAALQEAKKRGVTVEIVLDRSNQPDEYAAASALMQAGCDVRIDAKHAISHDKMAIVDGRTIITGGFNFTKSADDNRAENLIIMHNSEDLAGKFLDNFHKHQKHSDPYTGAPGEHPSTQPEATSQPAHYVGSKTANVYHYPNCRDVEKIDPADRVEWDEPPPGKRLHKNCPK